MNTLKNKALPENGPLQDNARDLHDLIERRLKSQESRKQEGAGPEKNNRRIDELHILRAELAMQNKELGLLLERLETVQAKGGESGRMDNQAVQENGGQSNPAPEEMTEVCRKLEALVEERTAALSVANKALKIERAERKQTEQTLRESEERYRSLLERQIDLYYYNDLAGRVLMVSPSVAKISGYTPEEVIGLNVREFYASPSDRDSLERRVLADGFVENYEVLMKKKDGHPLWLSVNARLHQEETGAILGMEGVARDISEQKRTEKKLQDSESRYRRITEALTDYIYTVQVDAGKSGETCHGPGCIGVTGYSVEEFAADPNLWLRMVPEDDRPAVEAQARRILEASETAALEHRIIRKDGAVRWVRNTPVLRLDEQGVLQAYDGLISDITERKQAEEESEKLHALFNQAQKMESVGRLAGGVAHDFNNMLSVIIGHTEMALEQTNPSQPLFADLEEILHAAERSADLTRQLLAFARQQTITPTVIDLNQTVEGMLRMLQRLIGEDIELSWSPGTDIWPIKMDPSQIDQILANLCVNARDAIASVGRVTIETNTAVFDTLYCSTHPGAVFGEYVLLTVGDNGCGMDKETLAKLFEPFFTTKEMGKGTGLGLATVYGIVKQNNGYITVHSEPAVGSVFKIYLPRHKGEAVRERRNKQAERAVRGKETILLVEDEPAIVQMTTTMLKRLGYTVLVPSSSGEAVGLAERYGGEIDLVVTDVVMPEINGWDLTNRLLSLYPKMKRLFMSGYPADIIVHHGVLKESISFIQKPFSMKDMAAKVREVLDRE
jgi:two-component system cell cycle sensor histidine kinase/response regulator CckA